MAWRGDSKTAWFQLFCRERSLPMSRSRLSEPSKWREKSESVKRLCLLRMMRLATEGSGCGVAATNRTDRRENAASAIYSLGMSRQNMIALGR
ncbi:unnamed protein product [Protopolystoma xenopodis]|uniref:Uncharacterized protein n=1 Tax=Protopolystoma xenopodis TaxID=117903 RepID=A0A3S5BLL8_9PLAT|nr:unnamed protein product [Protopolystoma xenopodis]